MNEIELNVGGKIYRLTNKNNNNKFDRAVKDAGQNASSKQILAHYDKFGGYIQNVNGSKVENGQFWRQEKEKLFEKIETDLTERERFEKDFMKRLKKEKSNYAKLILQENLVSYKIVNLLTLIQSTINLNYANGESIYEAKIFINLPDSKKLQEKTLGALAVFLRIFLNNSSLLKDLDDFVKRRNKITHKAFYEYEKFADLDEDSKAVTNLGERILEKVEVSIKELINLSKNMIKEIKSTDLIKDSRIVINDNFRDLDNRLKKVEERLKVKESKDKKRK